MNEHLHEPDGLEALPQTEVSRGGRISIVWLIPLVAALVGGWLAYKAYSEQGPTISIDFKTADGLEAGKTKVRFKDVEVGRVEAIDVSNDLSHVVVTARLVPAAARYLTENTRFWVARARVTASQVSGLGTLFAGAHIEVGPSLEGAPARHFVGLEEPPAIPIGEPGRHFFLESPGLASLNVGSPIYFRQIQVGQVESYALQPDRQSVKVRIFVREPYDDLVAMTTRFWNASGLDVSLTAEGVKMDTASLVSLLIGGVAFETPKTLEPSPPAPEDAVFKLYANREDADKQTYLRRIPYLLYFDGSVRGLNVGAPVEFRGIRIGQVLDVRLEFQTDELAFRIPVLIELEPDRIDMVGDELSDGDPETMDRLVAEGLRAQLKSGSLITGALFVDLDFHPDAPAAPVEMAGGYRVLPTVPAPLEALTANAKELLDRLQRFPLDEIGTELRDTLRNANRLVGSDDLARSVKALDETLRELQGFAEKLNRNVEPQLQATLLQAQSSFDSAEGVVSADSALYKELKRMLAELSDAARSIRNMADYLERHPDALLYGKGGKR